MAHGEFVVPDALKDTVIDRVVVFLKIEGVTFGSEHFLPGVQLYIVEIRVIHIQLHREGFRNDGDSDGTVLNLYEFIRVLTRGKSLHDHL